jgi:hypothetical protein
MRNSGSGGGGLRNGLIGDNGASGKNSDGVFGSQCNSAGKEGVLVMLGSDDVDVVHGSGKVARRGVDSRGSSHDGVEIASGMETGRGRILDEGIESLDDFDICRMRFQVCVLLDLVEDTNSAVMLIKYQSRSFITPYQSHAQLFSSTKALIQIISTPQPGRLDQS